MKTLEDLSGYDKAAIIFDILGISKHLIEQMVMRKEYLFFFKLQSILQILIQPKDL